MKPIKLILDTIFDTEGTGRHRDVTPTQFNCYPNFQ